MVETSPDPLTPPDCDLNDTPFPDALLVQLAASDLGLPANAARDLARSVGWVEVPGGWKMPIQ